MFSPSKEIFKQYTDPEQFDRIVDKDSVSEMWRDSVTAYPDVVAIEDDGKRFTYADIEADVSRLRTVIKSDDDKSLRVGVYCPNSYDFVRAFLAVTTLGYTAVILPAQLDNMTVFGCTMMFGLIPIPCSSLTLCCVGLDLCSPLAFRKGTSVTWI